MKCKYRPHRNSIAADGEYIKVPLISVNLKYGSQHIALDCLVDSGAGDCLFGVDIAVILGIDLTNAATTTYFGIGDTEVVGYNHPVFMNVCGFDHWIEIPAGFIQENETPLLGQAGFFDNYEVTFRGYQNQFEVNSIRRSPKHRRRG